MDKKLPTIDIHGKEYTLVSTRILHFNEVFINGKIETEMLQNKDEVVVRAKITPDIDKPERHFIAHSQAVKGGTGVNKTAALENCETSAVGRALGFMGIGVIENIASADEVNKAETQSMRKPADTMQNMWCPLCEENAVISKKTGKPYCPTFKKHPQGQYVSLTAKPSEKEQEFEKSLDIDEINSMT